MRKIAVVNHKGGVGKTTLTLNIAGSLAEMGYQTLVVDCDSQGDLSAVLAADHSSLPYCLADLFTDAPVLTAELIQPTTFDNLSIITADRRLNLVEQTHSFEDDPIAASLADALAEVRDDFDFALFDCATKPHLSGYAALVASDEVVVPCEPSQFSLRSLATIHDQLDHVQRNFNPALTIRYVLSKDAARSKKSQVCRDVLENTFGKQAVFATSIPKSEAIDTATNLRKPLVFHSKRSKIAQTTRDFVLELIGTPREDTYENQAAA